MTRKNSNPQLTYKIRDRERMSEKNYNNFFATLSVMYFTIFRQMSDVITNIPI